MYSLLKRIIAICAFLGILLQTFSQVVILADYYVHKDYIAKNLCENRDKPKMHCNGKCCLKKKLAKEGKEQTPSNSQKEEQAITLFYSDIRVSIPNHIITTAKNDFISRNDLRTASYQSSIFHPPGA